MQTEKTLIKAKNGDMKSFESLIIEYEKLYFNIAFRITGDYEDAKDVTQDALIKIYKNLDKCMSIEHFKNWSAKIVTNTSLDYYRSSKRKNTESLDKIIETVDGAVSFELDSKTLTPEEELIKKLDKELILKCIDSLPENYKTIIILRELNNLSYDEISSITELSLGTVKSRISRARNQLKNLILNALEQSKIKNVT